MAIPYHGLSGTRFPSVATPMGRLLQERFFEVSLKTCPIVIMTPAPNYINIGFSKCATSSLWQFLFELGPSNLRCLRTSRGALEFDLRKDLTPSAQEQLAKGGCFLKFSGAIFGERCIDDFHSIASRFGDPVYIISFRSPVKVLPSWYKMHKAIASKGTADHFAVREKDKYMAISIEEYARLHAGKLDYASHIRRFLGRVGSAKTWILDFRALNRGSKAVVGKFMESEFPDVAYSDAFPHANASSGEFNEEVVLPADIVSLCNDYERDLDKLLEGIRYKTAYLG